MEELTDQRLFGIQDACKIIEGHMIPEVLETGEIEIWQNHALQCVLDDLNEILRTGKLPEGFSSI